MPEKYNKSRVQFYYDLANEHAVGVVERMARDILIKHPRLDEFVMAMGSVFFTERNGDDHVYLDQRKYMRPLMEFLIEWNDQFGLTGTPMRFTATGDKRTDW